MALDTAVFCFLKTPAKSCAPFVAEPPRITAGLLIGYFGIAGTLARRTRTIRAGVPAVPVRNTQYWVKAEMATGIVCITSGFYEGCWVRQAVTPQEASEEENE